MTACSDLNEATIKQLTWKPGVSQKIAVEIVKAVYRDGGLFADEVDLDFVDKRDGNCIGLSWRRLQRAGIISRENVHRSSKKARSNGRTVWRYVLASGRKAEAFLKRNGVNELKQTNLPGLFE